MNIAVFSIVLLLLVLGIVYYVNREKNWEPDYRLIFILGLIWIPIGLSIENIALWMIGAVFMLLGLINHEKWKARAKGSELSEEQKKLKLWVIVSVTVLLLLGIGVYILR